MSYTPTDYNEAIDLLINGESIEKDGSEDYQMLADCHYIDLNETDEYNWSTTNSSDITSESTSETNSSDTSKIQYTDDACDVGPCADNIADIDNDMDALIEKMKKAERSTTVLKPKVFGGVSQHTRPGYTHTSTPTRPNPPDWWETHANRQYSNEPKVTLESLDRKITQLDNKLARVLHLLEAGIGLA